MNVRLLLLLILRLSFGKAHEDTIVIDAGDGMMKAGFAGDDAPRVVFEAVVGRPKDKVKNLKEVYIGPELKTVRQDDLHISYPLDNINNTNWDDMTEIWRHIFFDELRIFPEEHPIIITDKNFVQTDTDHIAKIMFENFKIPSLYIANEARMSLIYTERTSGLVIVPGLRMIYVVPIIRGEVLTQALLSVNFGNADITDYLMKIIDDSRVNDKDIAKDIQKTLCYVALDLEQELQTAVSSHSLDRSYELPSGEVIILGNVRFRCPEAIFQPRFLGSKMDGIHVIAFNSIMKINADERKILYQNIVLSGSLGSISGIKERLEKEIKVLAPPTMDVEVILPHGGNYAAWFGASQTALLPSFGDKLKTKEDF